MVASEQFIENIIAIFAQATEANRNTPGRQGNLIVITKQSADDVMITGDLHGHRRNFNLINRIAALDKHPRRHLIFQELCHGGPVYAQNKGCMSHTLLEDVAILKTRFPQQVHVIMGNHELSELTNYPIQKNKQLLNLLFRMGLQQKYGAATDRVRKAYMAFIDSCPLAVRMPSGIFVSHSIPENCDFFAFDPGIFNREISFAEVAEGSDVFRLLWGRDCRPENVRAFAKLMGAQILINGHEPCLEGYSAPNDMQIIVDCCSNNAAYVILPTNQKLTHADVLNRVRKLE